ncbi:zinc finger MYM-type protein 1-like isoform X2 [Melanaphis sacchari]|uniref:zinc finger MYM-type protein 1-like isoform X2 n=1 Tax=Melanaphis sacchari TaxID=742174 RepID=UPI000DC13030|nr:zinc finger MYM-type protein 1-like isoform X2 [Melanaphis sacchari]
MVDFLSSKSTKSKNSTNIQSKSAEKPENSTTCMGNTINDDIMKILKPENVQSSEYEINCDRDPGRNFKNAYNLLCSGLGPYQPTDCDFPKVNGRKFRIEWYVKYPWLEYSPSQNSVFCFYCRALPSASCDQAFITNGFKSWKKMNEYSTNHSKSFGHKESLTKYAGLKSAIKHGNVISKIDSNHKKVVKENREYIKCLLETLLYCAYQGIPIRGHRENEDSENMGNFLELMKLRAKDNNILDRYFLQKEKSFRYVTGTYTNEFISLMAAFVTKNIIKDIQLAGIYSILIDETQDLARHEQVSFIIRYVDGNLNPHEVFIGFYRTARTDGECLTNLIKVVLNSYNLRIEDLRGQCYDGAASMRGSYNGVQAKIRTENPLAFYVHCHAHILNLCLVDLAKQVSYVRNTFGTLKALHNFIGASSKRYEIFEQIRIKMGDKIGPKTLKSLSDTRWSCRIDALDSVLSNFTVILKTLEDISEQDSIYGSDASSLLFSISNFEFVFCIVFLNDVMRETNILSKYLQSPNINYANVNTMTLQTVAILNEHRSVTEFDKTWNKAMKITKKNNISSPKLPRKRTIPLKLGGGQVNSTNIISVQDMYKINIYYIVLDIVIKEIQDRFKENDLNILQAMKDVIISEKPENNSIKLVCETYNLDFNEVTIELAMFNRMFKTKYDEFNINNKIVYLLCGDIQIGFTNYTKIIKIFLTIPTNTSSCERTFSCLKRLKSYLRTSMGQERLSGLALLQIQREVPIDFDKVIDEFVSNGVGGNRKLTLK